MKSEFMTIYGRYRKAAGLTQERGAELLGVTVRSVAAWERGESVPPDMRVLAMADIYNAPTICIEHLRFNVAIARDVLPPVPYVHLPQAVCQLCAALRKVQEEHAEDQLLAIAADGRVDEMEERQFVELTEELDDVIAAAKSLSDPAAPPIELPKELSDVENELNLARSRSQENLRARREAEQRKNDLIMYLAHDLKTPLSSVIGYLTLLHDEGEIAPALREKYLSIALGKANRLEDLINEFFEITRFNLSAIELQYGAADLSRLLEQLTFEFQPMLREKNLTCALSTPETFPIRCDANKLQRVFDNLLRNAVLYCYPGTEITVTAERVGNFAVVRFRNRGDTIPPEKLSRIFEQFYRLDTARSSTGGAGLGLAIARQITQLHGGSLTGESRDDTVTFTVTLPIEKSAVGKS